MRDVEGQQALLCIGERLLRRLVEHGPTGIMFAFQQMLHFDGTEGMRQLADYWQRVMGALVEARG